MPLDEVISFVGIHTFYIEVVEIVSDVRAADDSLAIDKSLQLVDQSH